MNISVDRRAALWMMILLVLIGITGATSGAEEGTPASAAFVPNELLIGIATERMGDLRLSAREPLAATGLASLDALNQEFAVHDVRFVFDELAADDQLAAAYGLNGILKLTFPAGTDLFTALERYRADPAVRYAELNRVYVAFDTPNDPDFGQQWGLHNTTQTGGTDDADIDAPEAWDVTQGSGDVLVAVIDTGVNYNHADLDGGRVRTDIDHDFINDDDDAMDDQGHGTFVAGIIAADTNDGVGIAGVCANCRILPVKVLDGEGSGSAESVAQGIQYAADQGADVLNMSLGFPSECGCSQTVAGAINYAYEKGALLVAASGNDSDKGRTSYPSSSPRVMAVGASDHNDQEADFSNRDSYLDIMAPGVDIYGLDIDPDAPYRTASGTSAAAPHVAGVAGLILSTDSSLDNAALWYRLYQSADDFPAVARRATVAAQPVDLSAYTYHIFMPGVSSARQTYGRLNAHSALTSAVSGNTFSPVDTCSGEPSCTPGCGAEVALSSTSSFGDDLQTLRRFRDTALAETAAGAGLTARYNEHRLEVALILATDAELRAEARALLNDWLPVLVAVTDPAGGPDVAITANLLSASLSFVDRMTAVAGPQLTEDLHYVAGLLSQGFHYDGWDAAAAWADWAGG